MNPVSVNSGAMSTNDPELHLTRLKIDPLASLPKLFIFIFYIYCLCLSLFLPSNKSFNTKYMKNKSVLTGNSNVQRACKSSLVKN